MKQRFRSWFVAAAALLLTPFLASADQVAITITPKAAEKAYDGTPLMASECEVTFAKKGETWVNPGDHAVAEYADEIIDVYYKGVEVSTIASRIKSGSAKILNAQGADVSASYAITLGESTLKVTPRAITVTTPSYTNEYNGVAQSSNEVFVTTTGGATWNFPANDGVIVTNFASIVKAGTTTNWVELVFADASKTNNYVFTENFGELVIKKCGTVMQWFDYGEVLYLGRTNDLGVVANVKDSHYQNDKLQGNDKIQYVCAWSTNKNCGTYAAYLDDHHLDRQGFKIVTNGVFNANGENVTDCYKAIILQLRASSTLKIVERKVTLTSASATKMYDGTPLTNHKVLTSGDGFVAGEGVTTNVTGSQTIVGSNDNYFSFTWNQGTDENNYNLVTMNGMLEVTNRVTKGEITSASITKEYDGLPASTNEFNVSVTGLAAGDEIVAWCCGASRTDAGVSTNDVSYYITNKTMKADVTANYAKIATNPGLITVTARPITVQFFDATYTYDGEPHYPTDVVIEGTLVAGDGISASWIPSETIDAGVYACTNNGVSVTNEIGYVGINYAITCANTNALVTVQRRPATVTTKSAEKFYDGTPLKNDDFTISGFLLTELVSSDIEVTGEITEVGRTNNTFVINWKDASREANYSITTNMGTLTVKAQRMAYDLQGGDFTNSDQVAWSFVEEDIVPPQEIQDAYEKAVAAYDAAVAAYNATNEIYIASSNAYVAQVEFVTNTDWTVKYLRGSSTRTKDGKGLKTFDECIEGHKDLTFTLIKYGTTEIVTKYANAKAYITYQTNTTASLKAKMEADATNLEKAAADVVAAEKASDDAKKALDEWSRGAIVNFYTPVRKGYELVCWTNELTGLSFKGDGTEQKLPKTLAESEIASFKAVWEKTGTEPEMTAFFDATDKILEAPGAEKVNTRDAKYGKLVINNLTPYAQPELERYYVDVTLKFPNSINTRELVGDVTFCVDGGAAFKPWGELRDLSLTNAVSKPVHDDDLGCWKVTWRAYVTKGMLSEALTNEVGQAFATTKLYCRWSADAGEKYQTVYTANFDADKVELQVKGETVYPQVQSIAWDKGYDTTKSEVNSNEWAAATAITSCDIREDAITVDDLTRTGYVFKGWSPATTRGYVAQMKDVVLENMEVLVTALWETNTYTAVFTNELKYADDFNIIYKDPTVTNVWTVEDLELDLPGKGGVSAKYYWFDNWTNAAGKVFSSKKIQLCDIGTDTVAGTNTLTFWASMSEKNFKIRYDLTNGFEQINKPGTPYQAFANNIRRYSVSTNDGEVVALNDASCFGCKFLGWSPSAVIDPMAASNMTFTAKWAEYQAMVVENDTATTNFFTDVAEALATVTNSNTTIAFLDAKGDGIQGACPIVIADNLKNIEINFCALDYTNTVGDAALTIGANATVAVKNYPQAIGYETNVVSRLVQVGGNAVKVGEGSIFTFDDANVVLDVTEDAEITKKYEEAKDLYFNGRWRIARIDPNKFRSYQDEGTGIHAFYDALIEEEAKTNVYWASEFSYSQTKGVAFYKASGAATENVLTNMDAATECFVKVTNDYWTAKAAFDNCAAIYAPSNATLVLKAGTIGAKAYGETNKCASIDWVGHREYLGSTNLFFATKPLQESAADGYSQVAAGYIWTLNANEATSNEFAYTVSPIVLPTVTIDYLYYRKAGASGLDIKTIISNATSVAEAYTMLANKVMTDGSGYAAWTATPAEFDRGDTLNVGDLNTTNALEILKGWADGVVAPGGTMLGTNATLVGTLFVGQLGTITNKMVIVKNPSAVVVTNAGVVAYRLLGSDGSIDSDPSKAEFMFGLSSDTNSVIQQLVKTLETGVATNVVAGYDWDGAAGSDLNMVAYTLNYSAKDIVISNATEQLFPKIATIKYTDNDGFLVKPDQTYTILDTTKEGGLVLEPAIGLETNDVKGVFRFVGWEDDYSHEIVSNIVHTVGAGDDVTNRYLTAKWDKLEWVADSPTGTLAKVYFTPQEAIDDLPNGGTARYTGTKSWKAIAAPLAVNGKAGVKYTIDLGGKSFVSDLQFKGDYLVEITGGDVTLTNGTLSAGLAISGPKVLVGGVRAVGADTKVTLAKGFKVMTYMTMVCADDGSTVTADGAQLNTSYAMSPDAGVKVLAGATLVFTNMYGGRMYENTILASNATVDVSQMGIMPEYADTVITALAGAMVRLGTNVLVHGKIEGNPTIVAEDSTIEVNHAKVGFGDGSSGAMKPVVLLKNSTLVQNDGTIANGLGMGVYSTVNAAGESDNAAVVLNGGRIEANGVAIQIEAGALTVPQDSTFYGSSKDATVCIENTFGLLTAEDIKIEGGTFDVKYGETTTFPVSLISRNSQDPNAFVSNFLRCAYVDGVKGALFKTAIPQDYCAMGYKCCVDGERIEKMGEAGYEYWYYVDTIAYDIDYDLDGGTRVAGTEVWPTSYDVEDDVILLPSNTVKKTNYWFGGWSISNALTGVVTTNMTINPKKTNGNLALTAIWNERPSRVYVDFQGVDKYPKYVRFYNETLQKYYWLPKDRYQFPNEQTGEDAGTIVTPSQNVKLATPTYTGYDFLYFEDVANGRRYEAGGEYTILDFTFDSKNEVHLRGVWASVMGVMDDKGNRYNRLEDAITNAATVAGTTLHIVGPGSTYFLEKTIVIDKDITLNLNEKILAMSEEGFEGDTLVVVTNAPDALVLNGTLLSVAETNSIKVLDADAAAVPVIDADWLLKFGTELSADYIADGYLCQKVEDESGLYEIVPVVKTLTFAPGLVPERAGFVVELNNDDTTFTCVSDPIAINDATLTAYDFTGWFDGAKTITDGWFDPQGVTKDITLTAQWKAHEYSISYETEGGVVIDPKKTYNCEEAAFTLVNAERPGYTFKGWRVNGATTAVVDYTIDPLTMAGNEFVDLTAVAVWEANCYTITFDTLGGKPISDLNYNESLAEQGVIAIPAAEKVGCKFVKWVDEQGQTVKTGVITDCFSAKLTAVYERVLWTGDNTVVTGNPSDGRGTVFNGNLSYTGSIIKDGLVAGKVAVTVGKPNTKGVATVTMTVSQELLTGKTYTLKNTAVEVTGDVLKNVELTGGTTRAPIAATIAEISDNGLTGTFEGYEVIASADRFATNVTKIPAATLAYLQGNWTAAFACTCEGGTHGAATLKLTVAAKGKVTVTGNLPDGTAVSTTAQLIYGDGVCLCPVVINAYNKKGGMSFMVWFGTTGVGDNLKDDVQVTNVSPIYGKDGDEECKIVAETVSRLADMKVADLAKDLVFKVDLAQLQAGLPEGYIAAANQGNEVELTFNGTKHVVDKASKVSVDATTGEVKFDRTNGDNDLQLSLTLTTSTGAITGSFKVYASYKSGSKYVLKTYTAKVYGVLGANDAKVYGVGTSTQADIGSAVFTVVAADVE